MVPDNPSRLKEIFTEAAELHGSDRVWYLDKACADDPELRTEVEALLAAMDEDDRLLKWNSVGELLFGGVPDRCIFDPGDQIGDSFRIIRLIGIGGMGEVYEAEDLRLGGRVAVKTLRSRYLKAPEFAARFRREIQLARRVTHRNVCRIFDLGRDRVGEHDVVYLTMELLEGETLAARLTRGALSAAEVKEIARQLAQGLAALHAANVIHRDLKPSNILLAGTRVVITDFGLAHQVAVAEGDESLSLNGQIFGTPAYAAPEQLTGRKVGPQSDIYSLGLVMYEMLTGRKPFEGGTAFDAAARKLNGKPTPPSKHTDVSPGWDRLILHCIELEPDGRIRDTAALLEALESPDLLERPPAPQPENAQVLRRDRKTIPKSWWIAAVIAAILLLPFTGIGSPLRRRGCELMPGTAMLCDLPPVKDIAVFPFTVQGRNEAEQTLATGWGRYVRESFHRLALNPKMCVHLRNDHLSEGVRLVLEGHVETRGDVLTLTATVRENAQVGSKATPLVLRRIVVTSRLDSAGDLELAPLEELARALGVQYDAREWAAWVKTSPKHATTSRAHLTGLGLLAQGKFEMAAREFNSAIDPTRDFAFPAAHVGLADAYRLMFSATRDPALELRARRAYERALPLDQDFGFGGAERGMAELDRAAGRIDAAIGHYATALKLWPYDHPLQKTLTSAYESAARLADAEAVLREGARRMPGCWQPHNALGALFSRHSRLRDSERSYLEQIRLAPDNGSAYHNLAFDYIKMGRYDDAINMASKSLEVRPYPMAYATLGRAYLYRGCRADALLNVRKSVELDPKHPILWSTLADALEVEGGHEAEVLAAAQRSVALARSDLVTNPHDTPTRVRYALNLARIGEHKAAVQEARLAIEQSPANQQVLPLAAEALERAGHRDEALAVVEGLLLKGLSVPEIEKAYGLSALRRDARYGRLLAKMHLDPAADPGGLTPQASGCPSWGVAGKGLQYN